MGSFDERREQMVRTQIAARGVTDEHVLRAMRSVRRESFVAPDLQNYAYDDAPLPIGEGQTISQPYIVAFMIEALGLTGGERVLEIGAGSGYAAAVASKIASHVYGVERIKSLCAFAEANLERAGIENVTILHADGTLGWKSHAPFDAILVSAGAPAVPEALEQQLAIGGVLVIPVGSNSFSQELVRVRRSSAKEFEYDSLGGVRFVPLVGEQGWAEEAEN